MQISASPPCVQFYIIGNSVQTLSPYLYGCVLGLVCFPAQRKQIQQEWRGIEYRQDSAIHHPILGGAAAASYSARLLAGNHGLAQPLYVAAINDTGGNQVDPEIAHGRVIGRGDDQPRGGGTCGRQST